MHFLKRILNTWIKGKMCVCKLKSTIKCWRADPELNHVGLQHVTAETERWITLKHQNRSRLYFLKVPGCS